MIERFVIPHVIDALARRDAVALIGPRQVGKTKIALAIGQTCASVYLDLEQPADRAKLTDAALFLRRHADKLVILDEIHRVPEFFPTLRDLIDEGQGKQVGRFLILGSASIDLLRQSGESLAGRIDYVDMTPLTVREIGPDPAAIETLWLRGGFPDSFLARGDKESFRLRRSFIRTYLDRDVPMFGPRIAAETLERLWTMLAHGQGTLLNASQLATGLSISAPTVTSYIGLLTDLLLVRRLPPLQANVKKRLVKSPKLYVRDTGLLHSLLGLPDLDALAGHPVVGSSWEGFVIENLLAAAPEHSRASFYRTAAGAEVDLILELGGQQGLWAIEIKRALTAKPSRGFHQAQEDLQPRRSFVVHAGTERYPLGGAVEAIGVRELAEELAGL